MRSSGEKSFPSQVYCSGMSPPWLNAGEVRDRAMATSVPAHGCAAAARRQASTPRLPRSGSRWRTDGCSALVASTHFASGDTWVANPVEGEVLGGLVPALRAVFQAPA